MSTKAEQALEWFRDRAIPSPRHDGVAAIIEALDGHGITVTAEQALDVWEAATNVADHTWLNAFSCINPSDEFAADVGRVVIGRVMRAEHRNVVLRVNAS